MVLTSPNDQFPSMPLVPGQSSTSTLQERHFLGPHVDCNKTYSPVRVTVIRIQQLINSQYIIQEKKLCLCTMCYSLL